MSLQINSLVLTQKTVCEWIHSVETQCDNGNTTSTSLSTPSVCFPALTRKRCDRILISANYIQSDNRKFQLRLLVGKNYIALYGDGCLTLVALESISPGQRIYYGTLRCHTLPSKENFPRQRLPPWFLQQILNATMYREAGARLQGY